jgi:DNA (cytosine-5)-methyltransferase 1
LSNLTAVSLFAGVGGFDLALTRAGVKVVAAVEIDKKCREVLALQFPETKLFEDVKGVTGEQLRAAGFVPERGIITAGFPCQDLSVAGLRKGLAGSRSGLFWEIIRIIDETHAEQVVLENVAGLLSSQSGQDMGIVITALVERGYGVCWRVLDSQNFGVPQRRRRVFIVASRGNHRRPVEILFESDSSSGYLEESGKKRKRVTAETQRSLDQNSSESRDAINSTATLLRMRGGKEGGGKGALVSEDKSLTIATGNDQTLFLFENDPTETQVIPIHDKATRFNGKRGNKNDGSGNGLGIGKTGDPMNTLTTNDRHSVFIDNSEQDEVFLFQCNRKDDHRIHQEVSPTLGCYVGSIPLAFAQKQSHSKYKLDNKSSTLNQRDYKSFADLVIEPVVRRLTPKEYERLQGFPDDWTVSQANSSRYKMLGNAVTVPVVEWIIKRMVKLISE